jgi:hypothetical protein
MTTLTQFARSLRSFYRWCIDSNLWWERREKARQLREWRAARDRYRADDPMYSRFYAGLVRDYNAIRYVRRFRPYREPNTVECTRPQLASLLDVSRRIDQIGKEHTS